MFPSSIINEPAAMHVRFLPLYILLITLTACASGGQPQPIPVTPQPTQASTNQPSQHAQPPSPTAPQPGLASTDHPPAWRICYFRTTWPEGEAPNWAVDLIVAHRILGPVVAEYGKQLQSWRFHRRAARDEAGHHLRFLFYSDSDLAARIINRIQQDTTRAQLLDKHILQSVNCLDPNDMSMASIGATSDPAWPETIQNQWPAYIMGISQMWLGLIDDAIKQVGLPATDPDALLEQYKKADEIVTTLWHVEGEHAFLHHLNGIFGYQPIHINF